MIATIDTTVISGSITVEKATSIELIKAITVRSTFVAPAKKSRVTSFIIRTSASDRRKVFKICRTPTIFWFFVMENIDKN